MRRKSTQTMGSIPIRRLKPWRKFQWVYIAGKAMMWEVLTPIQTNLWPEASRRQETIRVEHPLRRNWWQTWMKCWNWSRGNQRWICMPLTQFLKMGNGQIEINWSRNIFRNGLISVKKEDWAVISIRPSFPMKNVIRWHYLPQTKRQEDFGSIMAKPAFAFPITWQKN